MDDKQAKNSWDDLLQDLGAKPDESAFERQQAPDQDIPPTVEWSEAEESAAETEASPGDWNSLAESFGLEVEDAPELVEEPVVAKDEPPAIAEVKEVEKKEQVPERIVEEGVEKSDEPFGGFSAPEEASFEEDEEDDADDYNADDYNADDYNTDEGDLEEASTSDDELPPLPSPMEQALNETAWEDDDEEKKSETASDNDDSDDDSEGISGEAARSAFDALFSDGASGWGSAFLPKRKKEDKPQAAKRELVDDTMDADLSESLDAKTDDDGEDEETERPKRKRSRRRRRGGRGRKSASERAEGESSDEQSSADSDDQSDDQSDEISAEEVSKDEAGEKKARRPRRRRSGQRSRPVEASGESGVDDNDDDENLLDGDEEADGDHPRSAGRGRQLHRNLPTWSDAIGMIVDANLEQRAKSPSKPQSSRGGRGRGGRGRRRKSPESK